MYAVIFMAETRQLDVQYAEMAAELRELAQVKYGCRRFDSCCEGKQEIAISYWDSLEQISRWKQDPRHLQAQKLGKEKWYTSYSVEVVEVLREYASGTC